MNAEQLDYDLQIRFVAEFAPSGNAHDAVAATRASAETYLLVVAVAEHRGNTSTGAAGDSSAVWPHKYFGGRRLLQSRMRPSTTRASLATGGPRGVPHRGVTTCYLLNKFTPLLEVDTMRQHYATGRGRAPEELLLHGAPAGGPLLPLQELSSALARICDTEVHVVTSAFPGCGKTEFIQKEARRRGLYPIDVRIGGPLSGKDALETVIAELHRSLCAQQGRVLRKDNSGIPCCLHLQVNDVFFDETAAHFEDSNARVLSDMLFQLVLLKSLQSTNTLLHLRDIRVVFIEVANLSSTATLPDTGSAALGRCIPFFRLFPPI